MLLNIIKFYYSLYPFIDLQYVSNIILVGIIIYIYVCKKHFVHNILIIILNNILIVHAYFISTVLNPI